MKNQDECTHCEGTGVATVDCLGCDGSGDINVEYVTTITRQFADGTTLEDQTEPDERDEECTYCKGESTVESECTECEGTGQAA